MRRQGFKIDGKLIDKLRARGKKTGQAICWQIETAIKDFLNQRNRK